jgi:site-specific recombinase
VDACLQSDSGKRLIWGSADLVVQNVIDTAASVGRDYLDTVEASVWAAFRAGAWGGALMAIATAFKFLLASLHLPTLYEGLAFSLNYAATFCAAYLLHFTIATKLPAHTAAALARSVQAGGSHAARLQRFIEVWRTMVRLQLAGLVGNLVITVPLAFGIALAYRVLLGHDLLSPEKAQHVLSSHSLLGPSALYAALTGVMLWISSLVGSIVDNWARVVGLSERLATNVLAMKRFHIIRAQKRAQAMVSVVGGLSANVALGFMLGGVPALFAIAQLPVEIRHVTVSSGSVTMAWFSGGGSAREVALAVLGVLGIGVVNVTVSFWLALRLALRSTRGLRRESFANALVKLGIRRFWGRKRSRAEVAR